MGVLTKVRHYPPVGAAPKRIFVWQSLGAASGTQTLAPASVVWTWTIPAQTITGGGSTITLTPGSVTSTWVIPAQTVSGSGSGSIAPGSVVSRWTIPNQAITGGIQPSPGAATFIWCFLTGRTRGMSIPVFNHAVAITKSDSVNLLPYGSREACDSIYVGGAGDVVVVFPDDSTATYTAVAGGTLFVAAKRVNSTGTSATALLAQYIN